MFWWISAIQLKEETSAWCLGLSGFWEQAPRSVGNKRRLKINFSHNFLAFIDVLINFADFFQEQKLKQSEIDFNFFFVFPGKFQNSILPMTSSFQHWFVHISQ